MHTVEKHLGAVVLRAELGAADVLELDLAVPAGGDDEFLKSRGVRDLALGADRKLACERLDAAARNIHVLIAQGVLDIAGGELIGSELVRIQPQAHGISPLAADEDGADARHGLDALFGDAVHHVG